eukprot:6185782-Pleurochrysis_carterae.AAC.3
MGGKSRSARAARAPERRPTADGAGAAADRTSRDLPRDAFTNDGIVDHATSQRVHGAKYRKRSSSASTSADANSALADTRNAPMAPIAPIVACWTPNTSSAPLETGTRTHVHAHAAPSGSAADSGESTSSLARTSESTPAPAAATTPAAAAAAAPPRAPFPTCAIPTSRARAASLPPVVTYDRLGPNSIATRLSQAEATAAGAARAYSVVEQSREEGVERAQLLCHLKRGIRTAETTSGLRRRRRRDADSETDDDGDDDDDDDEGDVDHDDDGDDGDDGCDYRDYRDDQDGDHGDDGGGGGDADTDAEAAAEKIVRTLEEASLLVRVR